MKTKMDNLMREEWRKTFSIERVTPCRMHERRINVEQYRTAEGQLGNISNLLTIQRLHRNF